MRLRASRTGANNADDKGVRARTCLSDRPEHTEDDVRRGTERNAETYRNYSTLICVEIREEPQKSTQIIMKLKNAVEPVAAACGTTCPPDVVSEMEDKTIAAVVWAPRAFGHKLLSVSRLGEEGEGLAESERGSRTLALAPLCVAFPSAFLEVSLVEVDPLWKETPTYGPRKTTGTRNFLPF
ncbi:hypothetical protein F2P81_011986 [Scophthalmus maximus]|uniref:Uncharacterized protein n=1 Tax=Scophthalmus maximus TaxID=52904 RepID=A0A6A4T092_SCOMX|nr:hypothetical protein F2P81_011986 [Scophthalmus maximus]